MYNMTIKLLDCSSCLKRSQQYIQKMSINLLKIPITSINEKNVRCQISSKNKLSTNYTLTIAQGHSKDGEIQEICL